MDLKHATFIVTKTAARKNSKGNARGDQRGEGSGKGKQLKEVERYEAKE